MKRIVFLTSLLVAPPAFAQTPIDPLRRPDAEQGSYTYTVGVKYFPDGREFLGVDEAGTPFTSTRFSQTANLELSGSYSFSENIGVSAYFTPKLLIEQEEQTFPTKSQSQTRTDTGLGAGLFFDYRLAPKSSLDPQISLGFSYPSAANIQASASILNDPVVLRGSVGYSQPLDDANASLNLNIGAGFIANEAISLSGIASYEVPVGATDVPVTSLEFRAGYVLDEAGKQDISPTTTLSVEGGETRVGAGLELGGRGSLNSPQSSPGNNSASEDQLSDSASKKANAAAGQAPPAKQVPKQQTSKIKTDNTSLAAVEDLDRRLQEKETQIRSLEGEVTELQQQLKVLRDQLQKGRQENKQTK